MQHAGFELLGSCQKRRERLRECIGQNSSFVDVSDSKSSPESERRHQRQSCAIKQRERYCADSERPDHPENDQYGLAAHIPRS